MTFRPEMEVVRFSSEDVIAASGGLTNGSKMMFSGFSNKDITDNMITFDYRSPYQFTSSSTAADVVSAIGADNNTQIWSEYSGEYKNLNKTMDSLIKKNDDTNGTFNYTYVYESANNRFTRVS